MPFITYAAKRKIIRVAFSAAGTDISASDVDNSFNATTTDLSGLVTGNWVYVSGFTNSANNGWHQVTVNSTTGKITTSSALVTEAAGSAVSILGYDHGYAQSYSIDFDASMVYRDDSPQTNVSVSENGNTESILDRIDYLWSVASTLQSPTTLDNWREFANSVANAELFTFDPDGTVASPINPLTVILSGRVDMRPVDQTGQFRASFTVRER